MTNDTKRTRATRTDVARLADVSTAVVSYVFNNGPRNVAPETARRVREAARMLNYRPNTTARALRTGKTKTFGVIIPDFSNPYFAAFNDALETRCSQLGYSTLFVASHADIAFERQCIDRLLARNVDAIFAASAYNAASFSALHEEDCQFVVMDHTQPVPNVKCVATDFEPAVHDCVAHFLSHGHTATAMLFGGPYDANDPRIHGWNRTHQEAGMRPGPVVRSMFTRQGGYEAATELLDSEYRPTFIFGSSDLETFGAMRAIHEHGLRIPEDIAVGTLDGTIDTLYTQPQLTAVTQDTAAIAEHVIDAALHPENTPNVQLLPATVDIRQSCGCLTS